MTEETTCEGKQHEQMYPLAVNVTYQNDDRGKSGVKTVGYAAYSLEDRTPAQVARHEGYETAFLEMSPLSLE